MFRRDQGREDDALVYRPTMEIEDTSRNKRSLPPSEYLPGGFHRFSEKRPTYISVGGVGLRGDVSIGSRVCDLS